MNPDTRGSSAPGPLQADFSGSRITPKNRVGILWPLLLGSLTMLWVTALATAVVVVPNAPSSGPSTSSSLALTIAILATVAITIVALVRRRWILAAVITVMSVGMAVGASALAKHQEIDNIAELVQAESRVHDRLVEISQAFEDSSGATVTPLPPELRPLSWDDDVRVLDNGTTLYISVWENWRGEAGSGLIYTHDPTRSFGIGPGYSVTPSIDLGDGWWYSVGS